VPEPTVSGLAQSPDAGELRTENRGPPRARLNPFVRMSERFFAGGDRGRQLEELRHLSRWSRRLLAVTGERGVGKSSLYRAVSGGLDPGVKAARINANLTSDTREVLTALLQGFGVAAPAHANPQLLAQLITVHVEEQAEARRHCLVLVDDAHLLELPALEQLLRLVDVTSDDALRIVFFAETYFIQALDKASKRMSNVRAWHEIRLVPFGSEDARRYVAFRLEEAGVEGRSPFSTAETEMILRQSLGFPGRINEVAAGILEGEISVVERRHWLPRGHRAVVSMLLATMATVWLGWASYQHQSATAQAPEVLDTPPQPREVETLALPVDADSTKGAPVRSVTASESAPQRTAAGVEPTPDRGRSVTAPPATPSMASETPRSLDGEVATPAVARAPVEKVPEPPKPAPRGEPEIRPVQSAPFRGADWILDQPPSHFTLQLLATANQSSWQSYLAERASETRLAGFRMRRDGTVWYVILFGSYATRADAELASTRLPPSLGKVDPWVRTFESIQGTVIR